jgi:replicative DNA helicase
MITPHLEKIFFHNILENTEYLDHVNHRSFDDQLLKKLVPLIKEFFSKYHEIPTLPQVKEIVKLKGDDVTPGQLEAIWDIKLDEYDDDWLEENTETFITFKSLENSAMDLNTYLKTTTVNGENIQEVVQKAKEIILQRNSIDFGFNEGSNFFDASKHRQLTYNTFSSGYEFIDLVSNGGFAAKTLNVLLGQPKVGKSTWLGNIAGKSVMAGNNTAIITLEMDEAKYIKRLGANLLNIKMDDYKTVELDIIRNKLKNLAGNGGLTLPGELYVKDFPTSTASALDVENYLKKVEEKHGFKFKVVVIDYLNIMKNWRNANTENLYVKIKQIAEDVRAMAQRNEWAVITATQTNKGSFDSSDLNIGSASESSALVATVDLMFGIIQDPMMRLSNKYRLKVLATRDSAYQNMCKQFDVDYSYMRITEDPHSPISDSLAR